MILEWPFQIAIKIVRPIFPAPDKIVEMDEVFFKGFDDNCGLHNLI